MSLYDTGHSIRTCVVRVVCLSEHSSMRMHACFQLFLSLTFMSTDMPLRLKCTISRSQIICTGVHIMKSSG